MRANKTRAMIMAAGVGSRLDPLTKDIPKPLVPIFNIPVMDILIEKLANIGVKDVIANTYYLADKIIDRYSSNNFGINFEAIKEVKLSGTAGGFKKCQYFFNPDDTIVVLSGDGLSNADIQKGIETHKKSNAIATIGIKEIPQSEVSKFGVVVTDSNGYISEFQEKPPIQDAKSSCINTGIYIFNYKIFDYIPNNTFYDFAKNVFPNLLQEKQINTFEISEYWSDIGTLEQYKQSVSDIFSGLCKLENHGIETSAILSDCGSAIVDKTSTIGKNCQIGKNVRIENCIIWDNVKIEDDIELKDCIIGSNSTIKNSMNNTIIGSNETINKIKIKV